MESFSKLETFRDSTPALPIRTFKLLVAACWPGKVGLDNGNSEVKGRRDECGRQGSCEVRLGHMTPAYPTHALLNPAFYTRPHHPLFQRQGWGGSFWTPVYSHLLHPTIFILSPNTFENRGGEGGLEACE